MVRGIFFESVNFMKFISKYWRLSRILVASFFYLLAAFVLLVSLKMYPADLRDKAKDSFC